MHSKFRELLNRFEIRAEHLEPLKLQLENTWENLTETNTSEKKGLSLQFNSLQAEFQTLRKRHALGLIELDVYSEFKAEIESKIKATTEKLEELDQNLSNPKELINYTCKVASNLVKVWDSGDFYQKQIFQNTLFPKGLGYDAKNEEYRISEINSIFGYIAGLSGDFDRNKKGTSQNSTEKSPLVPGTGLEPVRLLRSQDFKSCVSTNSGEASSPSRAAMLPRDTTPEKNKKTSHNLRGCTSDRS